ncbi:hypothetical protein X798_04233 [Onchocerca flexuosa]|uniref:DUF4316 domain-containing protein n=2 Tax=Onchocerca flexuosa TaxID=387005 RepID=A0A183H3L2_9BILA|nr:hypothetical protein X798_04233 [Onchocerca flexuosa]VDO31771.1 unnamed protein product [Onchocerca flexuosa]
MKREFPDSGFYTQDPVETVTVLNLAGNAANPVVKPFQEPLFRTDTAKEIREKVSEGDVGDEDSEMRRQK